jgi:RimJ/RimL family protein N-acetyltransferase
MAADDRTAPHEQVRLVSVPRDQVEPALAGDLSGLLTAAGSRPLRPGRGWPHDDTAHALAFTEAGGLTWLVVDPAGAVVGELGTKGPPSADGRVEIGYGLAGPSRGRGLGTTAVRALIHVLARRPDLTALEADVALDNLASQRLLERVGFSCVGSDHHELHYRLELGRRDLG